MKRHPALVGLSHDHHHALVEARRLVRAAGDEDPYAAAHAFVAFFRETTLPHFREEEDDLFPLVAESDEARPSLVATLVEHQRLRALVAGLESGEELRPRMRETGELLIAHVRREERELFPLIERLAADALAQGVASPTQRRRGPVWGTASEDLNATLLEWPAGGGPPEHVNPELDVLVFVADGSATVAVDDEASELEAGEALVVPKGRRRRITAGGGGVRYLTVHLRRRPLEIRSAPARPAGR